MHIYIYRERERYVYIYLYIYIYMMSYLICIFITCTCMISYHITYLHISSYTYRYFCATESPCIHTIPLLYLCLVRIPQKFPKAISLDQSISAIAEAMTGQANQLKAGMMGDGSQVLLLGGGNSNIFYF